MAAYSVVVEIDQVVTRTVRMIIEAASPEEAKERAQPVIADYPRPIRYDPMIHRVVTTDTKFHIPRGVEFKEITEEKPDT